jgi:hypothetical protein
MTDDKMEPKKDAPSEQGTEEQANPKQTDRQSETSPQARPDRQAPGRPPLFRS